MRDQKVVWGWAIIRSDGTTHSTRPKLCLMVGGAIVDAVPYDSEDLQRADRDWPGLAPHRVVTLYTDTE